VPPALFRELIPRVDLQDLRGQSGTFAVAGCSLQPRVQLAKLHIPLPFLSDLGLASSFSAC